MPAPDSADLVRFLLARVEDDEAELKRLARASAGSPARGCGQSHPDRLRAETVAKRQIIGTVQHVLVLRDLPNEQPVREAALQVLRSLAGPYSAHPGFRDEWRHR
jgi:Family of unknown function (DUF6221)